MENKTKSRLLYIQQIMHTETDESHPLSIADIIEKLNRMGIPSNRRNVLNDLHLLLEFGMYDATPCDIELKCKNDTIRHIIDRFGEDVKTKAENSAHFIARIHTAPNPPFFAWVFQFCGKIKILSPREVSDEYMKMKTK